MAVRTPYDFYKPEKTSIDEMQKLLPNYFFENATVDRANAEAILKEQAAKQASEIAGAISPGDTTDQVMEKVANIKARYGDVSGLASIAKSKEPKIMYRGENDIVSIGPDGKTTVLLPGQKKRGEKKEPTVTLYDPYGTAVPVPKSLKEDKLNSGYSSKKPDGEAILQYKAAQDKAAFGNLGKSRQAPSPNPAPSPTDRILGKGKKVR